MYHSHFTGSHYQAGFRWGRLLLNHGNRVLENIPFEITRERIEYGESCVPVYKKYYPEILEEIRGIADGQKCSLKILQAFLFGMYAVPPQYAAVPVLQQQEQRGFFWEGTVIFFLKAAGLT